MAAAVTEAVPDWVIVVADRMDQAHTWCREHGVPFGRMIFAKADGDERDAVRLRGWHCLPYVELRAPGPITYQYLVVGEHYRLGGS